MVMKFGQIIKVDDPKNVFKGHGHGSKLKVTRSINVISGLIWLSHCRFHLTVFILKLTEKCTILGRKCQNFLGREPPNSPIAGVTPHAFTPLPLYTKVRCSLHTAWCYGKMSHGHPCLETDIWRKTHPLSPLVELMDGWVFLDRKTASN